MVWNDIGFWGGVSLLGINIREWYFTLKLGEELVSKIPWPCIPALQGACIRCLEFSFHGNHCLIEVDSGTFLVGDVAVTIAPWN